MKTGKIAAFLSGIAVFLLILMGYVGISGIYIYTGLDQAQHNYLRQMERDAKLFALQLADAVSKKDPLISGKKSSENYWQKNSLKRLQTMGTAVFTFPGEDNLVEMFFLSSQGQVISTNLMLNYDKIGDKNELSPQYNNSFFHRAGLLDRAQSSVRMVPKKYPLKYDVILGEKMLDKYRLTMNSTSSLPISATTLFIAKYINKELQSPVLNATAPVYGTDEKVLGTVHYMVHLLPLYAYIESYMQEVLYYFSYGLIAFSGLAIVVILLLILFGGRTQIIAAHSNLQIESQRGSEKARHLLLDDPNQTGSLKPIHRRQEKVMFKDNVLQQAEMLMHQNNKDDSKNTSKNESKNDSKKESKDINRNDQNDQNDQIDSSNEIKSHSNNDSQASSSKAEFIQDKREKIANAGYNKEKQRLQQQKTIPLVVKKESLVQEQDDFVDQSVSLPHKTSHETSHEMPHGKSYENSYKTRVSLRHIPSAIPKK